MKLSFRGVKYEGPHTEWEITEGKVGGVYRGSPWKVHHVKQQHRRHENGSELVYRGVHYKR